MKQSHCIFFKKVHKTNAINKLTITTYACFALWMQELKIYNNNIFISNFPSTLSDVPIMLGNCHFTLEGKQFRLGHYWTVMVIIEMIWYPAWTTNGEKICCNIHSRFALLLRILQSFNLGNNNVHYVLTWAHIKLLLCVKCFRKTQSWFIVWYHSFSTKRKSIITFGRYNRTIQFLPSLIPKRISHLTLRMIFAIKVRRNICCYTQRNCCDAAILIFILWGKCNAFKFPFGVVRLRQRHAHFWYINGLTVPK